MHSHSFSNDCGALLASVLAVIYPLIAILSVCSLPIWQERAQWTFSVWARKHSGCSNPAADAVRLVHCHNPELFLQAELSHSSFSPLVPTLFTLSVTTQFFSLDSLFNFHIYWSP